MMATIDSPAAQPGGPSNQFTPPHQQYQQARRMPQQQQQPQQQQHQPSFHHRRGSSQVQYSDSVSQAPGQKPARQFHPSQERNRPKSRSFSLRSDKSGNSGSQKLEPESHAEKESKRLHSKADPTMAMTEAEPAAVAATAKVSLGSLREVIPRDRFGNVIAEPDKSNPTRYRWERPLDTIRSFEAAIDGGYNRRSSIYQPSEVDSVAGGNTRRNSYFNSNNPRYPQDTYYAPNPHSLVPSTYSQQELRQRENYSEQGWHNGGGGGYGPRPRYGRMASEPQPHYNGYRNGEQNVYPAVGNHRSYETVASGSGASGGEPAGYQTDPTSSDNSSIERRQSPLKQQSQPHLPQQKPLNDYGIGFSQNSAYQPSSFVPSASVGTPSKLSATQTLGPQAPPPPPADQGGSVLRKTATEKTLTAPAPDKRKSWFSRKLSKRS